MEREYPAIHRENAARDLLDEIVSLVKDSEAPAGEDPQLDARRLVELLNSNFKKLDHDNDGISRGELSVALARPGEFSNDEYTMLYLVGKYFDTISELSDDEPGKQDTRISKLDKDILAQLLVGRNLTLAQLHAWFHRDSKETFQSPPPLTSGQ